MINLPSNVIIDKLMSDKIKADKLSMLDDLKLFLATFSAFLFADCKVYINANQQNTVTPCLFVDFYAVSKQKRLWNTSAYEIGLTISYVPKNALSSTELSNALLLMQQEITDIKEYSVQSIDGDITNSIANVTGVVRLNEANVSDYKLINKIEQELKLK